MLLCKTPTYILMWYNYKQLQFSFANSIYLYSNILRKLIFVLEYKRHTMCNMQNCERIFVMFLLWQAMQLILYIFKQSPKSVILIPVRTKKALVFCPMVRKFMIICHWFISILVKDKMRLFQHQIENDRTADLGSYAQVWRKPILYVHVTEQIRHNT